MDLPTLSASTFVRARTRLWALIALGLLSFLALQLSVQVYEKKGVLT